MSVKLAVYTFVWLPVNHKHREEGKEILSYVRLVKTPPNLIPLRLLCYTPKPQILYHELLDHRVTSSDQLRVDREHIDRSTDGTLGSKPLIHRQSLTHRGRVSQARL